MQSATVPRLQIQLLGCFQLTMNGEQVQSFASPSLQSLLAYLLLHRHTAQPRHRIAFLFWPDVPESQAKQNLRQLLYRLRRDLPAADHFLCTGRLELQWQPRERYQFDVAQFEVLIESARSTAALEAAVAAYGGELLPGHYDEWVLIERQRLQRQFINGLERLIDQLTEQKAYQRAVPYARRLLHEEPLREAPYRRLIRLHLQNGNRDAALHVYRECVAMLQAEFGIGPGAALQELHQQLLAQSATWKPRRSLPQQPTPFIGRSSELATITAYLSDENCRLLTLTGLGGIGKTRLAVEAAAGQQDHFAHGVFFVPLAQATDTDSVITTIAATLLLSLHGRKPLQAQLLDYLREKQLLLILDNFEHLGPCRDLLVTILQHTKEVKLLVTSRERLHLRWEWCLDISGLRLPDENALEIEHYSAVQLFCQIARRTHERFALTGDNRRAVARICRLVAGVPLAIELAAVWVQQYPPAAIARQIAHNLSFLKTPLHDVVERHRSIRAAFDYSWQLLSPAEQQILARLAVFEGPFSSTAAGKVTGATAAQLGTLVDKSVVAKTTEGPLELHPLIRQYAAEHLAADREQWRQAHDQHANFYTALLAEYGPHLRCGRQKETLNKIEVQINQIRAAWRWTVEEGQWAALTGAIDAVYRFFMMRGPLYEGDTLFNGALIEVPEDEFPHLRGRLLARSAVFAYRLGRRDEARSRLTAANKLFGDGPFITEQVFCINHLGYLAMLAGDYETAESQFRECLALQETAGDDQGLAQTYNHMGILAIGQGAFLEAERYLSRSLALRRQSGDRWGSAVPLNNLGILAGNRQDYEAAERYFQESLAIDREFGHQMGIASTLGNLGVVAHRQGAYEQAEAMHTESLALQRELGAQHGIMNALTNLGVVSRLRGQFPAAEQNLKEALQLAYALHAPPDMLRILLDLAHLWTDLGRKERAFHLVRYVHHHPASEKPTIDEAIQQESRLVAELPPAAGTVDGSSLFPDDLELLVTTLLTEA